MKRTLDFDSNSHNHALIKKHIESTTNNFESTKICSRNHETNCVLSSLEATRFVTIESFLENFIAAADVDENCLDKFFILFDKNV